MESIPTAAKETEPNVDPSMKKMSMKRKNKW